MDNDRKRASRRSKFNHSESHNNFYASSAIGRIINENLNSVSIVDKNGNIILVFLAHKVGNLVGRNVKELNSQGIYDWSTSSKALETGSPVLGIVKSKFGTSQIVTSSPIKNEDGEITMVLSTALDKDLIDNLNNALSKDERFKTSIDFLSEINSPPEIPVAESPKMRRIMNSIDNVSKTHSNIMITGESGTGKEVVARYIHKNSLRSRCPFIPVNCASISHELMESEFFGYVKGAFTGADQQGKPGLFEIADHGTLFLDEIAELPLSLQPKLLRVLETGEVKRVGGTQIQHVDVRLIAATNKNLKEMIHQQTFRSDLYYRLHVIPIDLPPLRERHEDILALSEMFLEAINIKYNSTKKFAPLTLQAFLKYSWPGNIRELRNVIERLAVMSPGDNLCLEENFLETDYSDFDNVNFPLIDKSVYQGPLKSVLKRVEKEYIKQVLNECEGKIGKAASLLGIHRTMLYRKTKE